jgi:hypothetical protein
MLFPTTLFDHGNSTPRTPTEALRWAAWHLYSDLWEAFQGECGTCLTCTNRREIGLHIAKTLTVAANSMERDLN